MVRDRSFSSCPPNLEVMRTLVVMAMVVVWAIAAVAWPDLPPRIPIHFDLAGVADGWTDTSLLAWFALPAFATGLGVVFGWLLPWWMLRLARANSPWLNVPRKQQFRALPLEARERAMQAVGVWLYAIATSMQMLCGWLLFGSARVADGRWDVLPSWPGFSLLAVIVGCAIALAFATSRSVRGEVARATS